MATSRPSFVSRALVHVPHASGTYRFQDLVMVETSGKGHGLRDIIGTNTCSPIMSNTRQDGNLISAQRLRWIDLCRSARRHIARDERGADNHGARCPESDRVCRRDLENKTREETRQGERPNPADHQTHEGGHHSLPGYQPDDRRTRRA